MTRVAAVTGGTGGIGGAIVAGLRGTGHEVAILDLNGEPAVDLAERGEVQAAAAAVLARHGRCDVLVHAAAAFDRASLLDLDPEVWHRVQAVNVESALWLAQALVPGMTERGFGRIVFVVSDTVWDPPAGHMLPYVASKAALIGIARTLARPRRDHGQLRRTGAHPDPDRRGRPSTGGVCRGAGAAGDRPVPYAR